MQVDRGVAERAELERRLGHANDRYLRLYTNPPDGPGRRIRTRLARRRRARSAVTVRWSHVPRRAWPRLT